MQRASATQKNHATILGPQCASVKTRQCFIRGEKVAMGVLPTQTPRTSLTKNSPLTNHMDRMRI